MNLQTLLHNDAFVASSIAVITYIIGWAMPNDALYKAVKPFFALVKARIGKAGFRFIKDKVDVIDRAIDDVDGGK